MKSKKQIFYKRKSISNSHLSGFLLLLLIAPGVVLIYNGTYLGILLIFLYLVYETKRKGVVLDFERKKIKFFTELFYFIKIGKWIYLSKYKSFKTISKTQSQKVFANIVQNATYSERIITIVLFGSKKSNFIEIKDSIEAKEIKEYLEVVGLEYNSRI